jgi:alpha-tubulin suppressor-like RCC1 family protein
MNRRIIASLALGAAVFLPVSLLGSQQKEGKAWSWGFGRNGELGLGSESNISLPQMIKNVNFVDIDCKKSLSAGITAEGKVLTWGKNRNGVLGHTPPNLNVLIPREVEFREGVAQVSCGYQHMCAITKSGEAYVWGLEQRKDKFRSIGTSES